MAMIPRSKRDSVKKRLKPAVQVALVSGWNGFVVLSQMASGETRYNRQSRELQLCSALCKDGRPMNAHKIIIYGRSWNSLSGFAGLLLSDTKFLMVLIKMLTFDKVFEKHNAFLFIETKTEDIRADLKCCNILPEASLAT